MIRLPKCAFAAVLGACCIVPAGWAAGQSGATTDVLLPSVEQRTAANEVQYQRGRYRSRYGSYYPPSYGYRPYYGYYGYYSRPRYSANYYPRVYTAPYHGYRYYSAPGDGYRSGRVPSRYGWYR